MATEWNKKISEALKVEKKWRLDAKETLKIYRGETSPKQPFNILFSNVETIRPAIFSSTPKPDVRRRYKDVVGEEPSTPPAAKQVAEILERSLSFAIDRYDFDSSLIKTVEDMLIVGRGVARVRYVPIFEDVTEEATTESLDESGDPVENTEPEEFERLVSEDVICEYVYWEDFTQDPVRNEEDVTWKAFRHKFTTEDFEENEWDAEGVDFSHSIDDKTEGKKRTGDEGNLAIVWEIWDKVDRDIKWLAQGKTTLLETEDDPLNLENFFPVPSSLYAIKTTDSMVPKTEYSVYKELANELNIVETRIIKLTQGLKLRGVYPKTVEAVEKMLSLNDNQMLGVENFEQFVGAGGQLDISKLITFAPIEVAAQVILQLRAQRDDIKQIIFEVTGISDILRGTTKASETATAQRIKSSFGTLRLDERKRKVAEFARDLLRMKAEIIGEQFERETIAMMTGVRVTDEIMEILRSDLLRAYNVDIETDSTVTIDKTQEKQEVQEILAAITNYLTGIAPFVQSPMNPGGMIPVETAKDVLLWALRSFKGSRGIEEAIEAIGEGAVPTVPQPGTPAAPQGQALPPEIVQQLGGGVR